MRNRGGAQFDPDGSVIRKHSPPGHHNCASQLTCLTACRNAIRIWSHDARQYSPIAIAMICGFFTGRPRQDVLAHRLHSVENLGTRAAEEPADYRRRDYLPCSTVFVYYLL